MKLIGYRYVRTNCFSGEYETVYELTLEKRLLFGLIRIRKVRVFKVGMFGSISGQEAYWDGLIESKQNVI